MKLLPLASPCYNTGYTYANSVCCMMVSLYKKIVM